eukprot:3607459-Amphidinium_carterae.1
MSIILFGAMMSVGPVLRFHRHCLLMSVPQNCEASIYHNYAVRAKQWSEKKILRTNTVRDTRIVFKRKKEKNH